MVETQSTFSQVRKIDNSRKFLPLLTTFLLVFLIYLFIWFFRGGSFRLYTSIFFCLYYVTHQIWLSVLLIGVLQNVLFMPLRLIGNVMDQPLKDFEEELDKIDEKQQGNLFLFYEFHIIMASIGGFLT